MAAPKSIDDDFLKSVRKLVAEGFVLRPPLGTLQSENLEASWKVVSDFVDRYWMKFKKNLDRKVRYDTRGKFFTGSYHRAADAYANEYRQRLYESARAVFKEMVVEFTNAPDEGNHYWPKGMNPKIQLVPRPRMPHDNFTPKMAEGFATNVLLHLGAAGAKTTSFTKDGGVDCLSKKFVAQVKHLSSKVSVATVRETIAVASLASRQPIIFAKSGFTSGALELAIQEDVLLFRYFPTFTAETDLSELALESGLSENLHASDSLAKRQELARRKMNA